MQNPSVNVRWCRHSKICRLSMNSENLLRSMLDINKAKSFLYGRERKSVSTLNSYDCGHKYLLQQQTIIYKCDKFLKLVVIKRLEWAEEQQCFNCFKKEKCQCKSVGCKKMQSCHYSLLHLNSKETSETSNGEQSAVVHNCWDTKADFSGSIAWCKS